MLQESRTALKQSSTPDQQPTLYHPFVALLAKPSRPTPPGPPPFVGTSPIFPLGTIP